MAFGELFGFSDQIRGVVTKILGEMAAHAARRLLGGAAFNEPFSPVPYFWSDQYDTKIQFVGRCTTDDEIQVVDGSLEDRRFVALFRRGDRVIGALAFNRPRPLMGYRRLIARAASWDDALAQAAKSSG